MHVNSSCVHREVGRKSHQFDGYDDEDDEVDLLTGAPEVGRVLETRDHDVTFLYRRQRAAAQSNVTLSLSARG